jgi:enoyl-CoA hydratase/carnithine racemase
VIVARAEELDVDRVLARHEAIIAVATERITAAALWCDFLIATENAIVDVDAGALLWRIGSRAYRLHLLRGGVWRAGDVADALVPPGADPLEWTAGWLRGRSEAAFDSAAALIRRRGGDPLERAEFARLFATGEPQEGLAAFLAKRKPQWQRST